MLKRAGCSGYPKVGNKALEEFKSGDKGGLLLIPGGDPEAIKRRSNIKLSIKPSLGEGI